MRLSQALFPEETLKGSRKTKLKGLVIISSLAGAKLAKQSHYLAQVFTARLQEDAHLLKLKRWSIWRLDLAQETFSLQTKQLQTSGPAERLPQCCCNREELMLSS